MCNTQCNKSKIFIVLSSDIKDWCPLHPTFFFIYYIQDFICSSELYLIQLGYKINLSVLSQSWQRRVDDNKSMSFQIGMSSLDIPICRGISNFFRLLAQLLKLPISALVSGAKCFLLPRQIWKLRNQSQIWPRLPKLGRAVAVAAGSHSIWKITRPPAPTSIAHTSASVIT